MNNTLLPIQSVDLLPAMAVRHSVAAILLSALFITVSVSPVHAATQTRTSSFAYDPATGLLLKETIEPDTGALCQVTEYTRDTFGNKLTATTRNCSGAAGEA